MELVSISNHPSDNNIKRKAKRANIITDEHNHPSLVYVDFRVLVKHYKEDNGIDTEYPLIPDYIFRLRADNSTFVDPATGNYVDSSFPNAMGEADYFINIIATSHVSIDSISEQIILRADSYQRFNNYGMSQIVTWI